MNSARAASARSPTTRSCKSRSASPPTGPSSPTACSSRSCSRRWARPRKRTTRGRSSRRNAPTFPSSPRWPSDSRCRCLAPRGAEFTLTGSSDPTSRSFPPLRVKSTHHAPLSDNFCSRRKDVAAGVNSTAMRGLARLMAALACAASLCADAADRVALLIGNNTYGTAPLRNAVNDAHDLGEALKDLGFQVIVRENASRKDMIEAIREFGTAIEGASTALFFYAGHAMQFKERNYLVPIDAAMGSEEDVTFFSVEIGQIFDRMDRARTRFNFIILDACRDNPFASSFKLTSAGLAQMSSPSGTLIAYATSPGSVAADGFGRNGIYTKNILQNIRVPDLPVEIMFKRVREGVERETRKLQTPWDSSSLKGDFAFATSAGAGRPAQAAGPSADMTLQIEREFWVSVRDSTRPEDIRAYLDKYPNGSFASLA